MKYRPALELYSTTNLSTAEICRQCGVSLNGFSRYVNTYHRHLMLERNGIKCSPEEAGDIKMNQRRGRIPKPMPNTRKLSAACDSMDYIEYNVSQIAREFGLTGTNLSRQLRTHYPEVLEFRERARQQLGLDVGLSRGTRSWCKEAVGRGGETSTCRPLYHGTRCRQSLQCLLHRIGTTPDILSQGVGRESHQNTRTSYKTAM